MNKKFRILIVALVFLAGCATVPAEPAATATPQPTAKPTATQTPIPPTSTPVESDSIVTKPDDIAGIWKFSSYGTPWHIDFHPNGTVYSNRAESRDKALGGNFWFEGTVFHFEDLACSPDARQYTQGTYEAHVVQKDGQNYKLYFKPIEEPCKDRMNEMKRGYIWMGPLE
jgi:hypothetical protein